MKSKPQCAIMNDYSRTVDEAQAKEACLDGNTCVRSLLDVRRSIKGASFSRPHYFDIAEDRLVGECEKDDPSLRPPEVLPLLYNPLPIDLPTVHKDLLILAAAYYGDVDRYSRLQRPSTVLVRNEAACLARGIYHNTMFAKWCSLQDWARKRGFAVASAIEARFIMNNDLSRVPTSGNFPKPYCIWHPTCAASKTYEELARLRPDMKHQAARACVVANYFDSFDKIDATPDSALWAEAKSSLSPFYRKRIEQKASEQGITLASAGYGNEPHAEMAMWTISTLSEGSTTELFKAVGVEDLGGSHKDIYGEAAVEFARVELMVCAADELKVPYLDLEEVYAGL
ncbi:hypothetical protein K402DRAFT_390892 [Aulographum hederae CBS 113979]|uniref:Uncharacterized protein n=1 Tax=Aulographum hederae CBS 113979 TaxID=1176131 RepID=A0A6G1H8M4_9PEZI|nr:hypothetical protein K402DRAFT_390892 [Aulographum hederae CBS 113979]